MHRRDFLKSLAATASASERNGTHWTTWNYKDVGVLGMLTLDPASPYMVRIGDLLKKKRALGADDWMKWLSPTPVKDAPHIDPQLNARCVAQTLLCFYTGTLMQPLYAGLFKGLSENELDHILSSFSAKQRVTNRGLVDALSRYMAQPA